MFSLTLEYKKRRRITVMEAKLLTLVTAFTTRPSGELKDFVNLLLKRSTLLASAWRLLSPVGGSYRISSSQPLMLPNRSRHIWGLLLAHSCECSTRQTVWLLEIQLWWSSALLQALIFHQFRFVWYRGLSIERNDRYAWEAVGFFPKADWPCRFNGYHWLALLCYKRRQSKSVAREAFSRTSRLMK